MDSQYIYEKKRSEFGKWCDFHESRKLEVDIKSDESLSQSFIRKDPITQGTQCNKIYAAHELNTTTVTSKDSGMHHIEGGWPKDINIQDEEQTIRYRRKIQKDELYIHTMLHLLPVMEHCILQNNVCNIYEHYFDDVEAIPLVQKAYSRTINVYRDPLHIKRPITHLSWSPDQGSRLAISYCDASLRKTFNFNLFSYIWDIENPNKPWIQLKMSSPIMVLEYNPKDSNILASGLISGQVAIWDVREASEPVGTSLIANSHKACCNQVLWINSKTGTEFFSASKDGQIKWWDMRKLQSPTESLVVDLVKPQEQNIERAIGISALQFEPSIGTRFMCGLENGIVISGNRKGKTPAEKIAMQFPAHYGPVINVERNPTFVRNFLTVGDWTARIWSEDCRESSIMWTPGHRDLLTGGTWSATRFSVFFLTKVDGTLDVWDLIVQQDSPVLSVKVCDDTLTSIRSHEQGQLVAVSSKNGTTYLIELSEALTTNQKNDKASFTALLDRETRREKIIEAKNKEQRLKMKFVRSDPANRSYEPQDRSKNQGCGISANFSQCKQEYESLIQEEMLRQASDGADYE